MPIKKPTKYRSSQKMRNYIANVEAKHFAELNRRFGGDAIAAKELELNQALGDSLPYVDNDTYDAMLSYWYNTKRDSGKAMIDAWRRYYANPTDDGFYAFRNSFNAGYNDEQNPGLRDRRDFERSLIKPIHDITVPEARLLYRDPNYDMNRAVLLGYVADEKGHYSSRDEVTGDILKYPSHSTFGMALYGELGEGYLPVKRKKGKLKANTQPTPMRQWMDNTFKQPVIPFKFNGGKEPTLLDANKVRMNKQGLFLDETGNIVGDSVVLPELEVTNSNILPEVVVTGYRPMELRTYYPLGKDYPYSGHSQLHIPITEEAADEYGLYDEDDEVPEYRPRYVIGVSKRPYAEDYNFITNNCADATLGYLNYMFGTKESPYLFTTPGDVRDYAISKLKGKLIKGKRFDKILIPRNKNNATPLSKKALEKYRKTVDNVGTSRLMKLGNRVL